MNSTNILTAFMAHGADIETIALIAETDSKQVQAAMRAEMLRLAEQSEPSVSAEPAPLTTARKAQAADSSPSPMPKNCAAAMKRRSARKAAQKLVSGTAPLLKTDLVTDWLRQEPLTCSDIAVRARAAMVETNDHEHWAADGLYAMRVKGLVIKPDAPGGKWRLA